MMDFAFWGSEAGFTLRTVMLDLKFFCFIYKEGGRPGVETGWIDDGCCSCVHMISPIRIFRKI